MIPWISRNLVWKPIYALRGERVLEFQREVRKFHSLDPERMREVQSQKLNSLLKYVSEHNEYYMRCFSESGLSQEEILTENGIQKVPLLTKEKLRADAGEMLSDQAKRLSHRSTSGSTGMPLKFSKDRTATAYMDALMWEVYGWHGVNIGDRQIRVWTLPFTSGKRLKTQLKDVILNRRRLDAFNLSKENARAFFSTARRFKPKYMYGVVNTTCEFGRRLEEQGFDPAELGLQLIITTGEILHERQREYLARAFKCRVVNEYGCTESGIIGFECSRGKLHVMSHNLLVEFLDQNTGEPVSPGEWGEVVLTELHSYGLPIIRYQVGDLARPSAEICDCGLPTPLIEEVVGRTSDLLVRPDGRKMTSAILSYCMPPAVRRSKTFQRSRDAIEILLQQERELTNDDLNLIEKKLRQQLGDVIKIDMKIVDDIPVDPSGKFRDFVSELDSKDD